MKRSLPVLLAIISGVILVLAFILEPKWTIFGTTVEDFQARLLQWVTIIGGFTLLLGVVSILRVNMRAYQQQPQERLYKLAAIIALLAMALPGLFPGKNTVVGQWLYGIIGEGAGEYLGLNGIIVEWLFNTIDAPMMMTMFATLAFYIASAAYRAFRARSADATLLLIAALLVMFWRVPMGEAALRGINEAIPDGINTFLMRGANSGVQRGIIIGAALGAASMSLRILLGIERTYLGKS